jgi:hypothetical protein
LVGRVCWQAGGREDRQLELVIDIRQGRSNP